MISIRMSVTDLDQYLYYKSQENMGVDEIVGRFRREFEPTRPLLTGIAFHKFLEHAEIGEYYNARVDDIDFVFTTDEELSLPPVKELKGEVVLHINGVEVTLVGKVDGLEGRTVFDHKTGKQLKIEMFCHSRQWRCYLWMFDCIKFTYNMFTIKDDEDSGLVLVNSFDQFSFYRYEGMEQDIRNAITEFLEFARVHLPERFIDSD